MSGAASNSAARRRRGGVQQASIPQGPGKLNNQNRMQPPEPPKTINPMELLLVHDKKLFGIEQYLQDATHKLESNHDNDLGVNIVSSNVVSSTLVNDVSLLKERVNRIEDGAPTFSKQSTNVNGIDLTRVEKLEQEVIDLKKLLLKVQTFSMETNLTLMKIKEKEKVINTRIEHSPINETIITQDVEAELKNIEDEKDLEQGITFSRTEKLDV